MFRPPDLFQGYIMLCHIEENTKAAAKHLKDILDVVTNLTGREDDNGRLSGAVEGAALSRAPIAGPVTVARDSFRLAPAEPADPLTLRHPGGDIVAVFDGHAVLKEGFNYTVDKEAGTVTLRFAPRFDVRFLVGG